jgi:hypothetical protein
LFHADIRFIFFDYAPVSLEVNEGILRALLMAEVNFQHLFRVHILHKMKKAGTFQSRLARKEFDFTSVPPASSRPGPGSS